MMQNEGLDARIETKSENGDFRFDLRLIGLNEDQLWKASVFLSQNAAIINNPDRFPGDED
jgi:hypothetical protein